MGNYASYYLIRIVGLEDKIKDFEYEVAHLKNLNKTLNIRFEVDKKEKDELQNAIEELEEIVGGRHEVAYLKKENEKYANSVVPSYLGTIDLLKEDIERLEKDNKTFKKRYETQIEENVSIFEETVALKKEIEELKNSSPPAGHTNYSWREILGKKPKN